MPTPRRLLAAVFLVATGMSVGCDGSDARFLARPSINQLFVTHATPGENLLAYGPDGLVHGRGVADALGSVVFRDLPAGAGYVVRGDAGQWVGPLTVMAQSGSTPEQEFYSQQHLVPGLNYIKTRDGTTLSAYVTLPGPASGGPYPTVVNYSGYNPSEPGKPIQQYASLCKEIPTICDPPSDPSGLIASLFGFATVSVNMRGTGCSGGAYDYFEPLQLLDGYDVIETVAAQDWVQFHKVGMTGLSYPGITQLFVASLTPPGLAAITPLSVIADTGSTLVPGGLLNTGFAVDWVAGVLDGAAPYGQGWEAEQVGRGDLTCLENQLLHGQRRNNVAQAQSTPYNEPALTDPLSPITFVNKINVPVFLAGSFQDEQTGPFFFELLNKFTGSPLTRFTVHNGVHPDGFAPAVLYEWKVFLDLFVAQRVPSVDAKIRPFAPLMFQQVFNAMLPLPPDRFTMYTKYEDALAAYKKEPPVRVIYESGAGGQPAGAPVGTFEQTFPSWPPPQTQPVRYYFHADGTMQTAAPTDQSSGSTFQLDPAAGLRVVLAPGGDSFDLLPKYDYRELQPGRAVVFETPALAQTQILLGSASADLWIRSSADDADLQVSVTEVRPDGQEVYVQSGWLRASQRALSPESATLWPVQTHLRRDAVPLAPGQWTAVRVPIPAFGHVFRSGSKIRVAVDTPGDVRARWQFLLKTFPGDVFHTVGHSAMYPSSIALPLLSGATATTPLPACPSLRGQPCRAYQAYTNVTGP